MLCYFQIGFVHWKIINFVNLLRFNVTKLVYMQSHTFIVCCLMQRADIIYHCELNQVVMDTIIPV